MTHPGFNSPRIADMRAVLDEVPLSDNDRGAISNAIGELEQPWVERHADAYDARAATLKTKHDTVVTVAEKLDDIAEKMTDDVKHGRITAAEARAWLRDARNDHRKLTEQHRAVSELDGQLADFAALDVAEYQAQMLRDYPTLAEGAPTLSKTINGGMR